jgi:hypothetical protein
VFDAVMYNPASWIIPIEKGFVKSIKKSLEVHLSKASRDFLVYDCSSDSPKYNTSLQ